MTRSPRGAAHRLAAVPLAVLVLVPLLLAAGCGSSATATPAELPTGSMLGPSRGTPAASWPVASAAFPPSPTEGVLVDIDAAGLSEVTGFTLRTAAGELVTFRMGTLENGAEFPPGHLAEHLATASPVRVFFRVEGADLVVYRLEDAG